MTLTLDGIRYCLQKYGDMAECSVSQGIIFDYTDDMGNSYTNKESGTGYIIDFISLGLVTSITLTTPPRTTINNPRDALNVANGSPVQFGDGSVLVEHDETSGDQWCYSTLPDCSPDGSTKCVGYDLYTCTDGKWILTEENSPQCEYIDECEQYQTQIACESAGCYWYAYPNPFGAPSCHNKEMLMAYLPFIVAGVGGAIIISALLMRSKAPAKQPPHPPYSGE